MAKCPQYLSTSTPTGSTRRALATHRSWPHRSTANVMWKEYDPQHSGSLHETDPSISSNLTDYSRWCQIYLLWQCISFAQDPSEIISDRGPQFAARSMCVLYKWLGIDTALTTAYHCYDTFHFLLVSCWQVGHVTGPSLFLLLQDSPLAFHTKRGRLTDADDSFVSYVDQVHW